MTYKCIKNKAPIKAGEKVGELIIEDDIGNSYTFDLISLNKVEDKTFMYKLIELWKNILS